MPRSTDPDPTPTPPSGPAFGCDETLERLELYLDTRDGSDGADEGLEPLAADEVQAVDRHLARCPGCAREMELATRLRGELRSLPEPALPRSLQRPFDPHRRPTRNHRGAAGPSPQLPPPRPSWSRWAPYALATLLILAAVTVLPRWLGQGTPPAPEPATSPAQLARAELEARYALARVAEATRRANREIREDVLGRRLVQPVRDSLARTLMPEPPAQPRASAPDDAQTDER